VSLAAWSSGSPSPDTATAVNHVVAMRSHLGLWVLGLGAAIGPLGPADAEALQQESVARTARYSALYGSDVPASSRSSASPSRRNSSP
jgi:hypothetical protein